jgi:phage tail-like protein
MASDRTKDPYTAFLFCVTVEPASTGNGRGSPAVGGFNEVGGLVFESELETMRVGGLNDADLQLVGPSKYSARLVLKRGLADKSYFWKWYVGVMRGEVVRRAVTIKLQNAQRNAPYTWTFKQACPVKWTGPNLQAGSSAVAFESIELIHRGLDLAASDPFGGAG